MAKTTVPKTKKHCLKVKIKNNFTVNYSRRKYIDAFICLLIKKPVRNELKRVFVFDGLELKAVLLNHQNFSKTKKSVCLKKLNTLNILCYIKIFLCYIQSVKNKDLNVLGH